MNAAPATMRMSAPFSATLALVDAEGFPWGTDGAHGVAWRVATATDHYAPISRRARRVSSSTAGLDS